MRFLKTIRKPFRLAHIARLRHQHKVRTKKHTIPYTHCHNCGQELRGSYCHNCGQYARDISPSLGSFVGQYFENSFQWDGKFFLTIRTLFSHPGRLSVAWAEGHVARYVFPLKLYMFVMVVFGFVIIAAWNHNLGPLDTKSYNTSVADFVIKQKIEHSKVLDSVSYERVDELLSSKVDLVDAPDQMLFNSTANWMSRLPIIFMFAMPLFAVITRWFFKRRYTKFIPHLVFAIHIHTLFFIVASVDLILRFCYDIPMSASWVTIGGSYLYTIFAAKAFFGSGWWGSSTKMLGVMLIYVCFCIFIIVAGFFANLYYDSLISGTSFTKLIESYTAVEVDV